MSPGVDGASGSSRRPGGLLSSGQSLREPDQHRLLRPGLPEQFCGKPKAPGAKSSPGIELRELHRMLRAHGLSSNLRVVDEALGDAQIRRELVANLSTADDYVIVNVLRSALGQKGGGHLSPLGAYDEGSDSFLLLDVNPNGHTWVWLPASQLFAAMRTPDVHENRGYLLVREAAPAP